MFELNEKVQNLIPYDPVTGKYRIRLDANESFVTPSQALREQIDEELRHIHFNRYPDPYAEEARKAFADLYGVPRSCVMAGNGSDEVITGGGGMFCKVPQGGQPAYRQMPARRAAQ